MANRGNGPKHFGTNPRMLVAVVALPDGSWRQIMRNHDLVPRPESPVKDDYLDYDPAAAVTIRSNRDASTTGQNR